MRCLGLASWLKSLGLGLAMDRLPAFLPVKKNTAPHSMPDSMGTCKMHTPSTTVCGQIHIAISNQHYAAKKKECVNGQQRHSNESTARGGSSPPPFGWLATHACLITPRDGDWSSCGKQSDGLKVTARRWAPRAGLRGAQQRVN
jgi:hypothetical protein